MNHALIKLARAIEWRFLEEKLSAAYTDKHNRDVASLTSDRLRSKAADRFTDLAIKEPTVASVSGATLELV